MHSCVSRQKTTAYVGDLLLTSFVLRGAVLSNMSPYIALAT